MEAMRLLRCITPCLAVLCAPAALGARLEIPLHVPLETVRQALSAELAASPARPEVVYRDGPCRYLSYQSPKLEAVDGRLRLVGPGAAAFGAELFGKCQNAAWQGSLEFILAPRIDSAGRLRLHIVDSKLRDGGNGKGLLGFAWDLSKRYVHPRVERFAYELGASRGALVSVMRSAAPAEQAAVMEQALKGLQVLEPRVDHAHRRAHRHRHSGCLGRRRDAASRIHDGPHGSGNRCSGKSHGALGCFSRLQRAPGRLGQPGQRAP